MYDHIAEIHQDPVGSVIAFHLLFEMSGTAQFFLHIVTECLDLATVTAPGNDKIICDYGEFTDVNYLNIFRFLIFQCLYGKSG